MEISSTHPHSIFSPSNPQKSSVIKEALPSDHGIEENTEIARLRSRDQEVRSHEQAHIRAAGGLVRGGATFSFQQGPNGRQYAVGGEVKIDTSPVPGDPEATIRKAKQIRAAALAPANPSAQDRAVAASATAMEAQARQEIREREQERSAPDEPNLSNPNFPRIDLFV